jgi:antitoxin component YwqK of YwqJK toxin-antitoxin module
MFATESSLIDYAFKPIDFVPGDNNTIIRTPSPIKISSAPISPTQGLESTGSLISLDGFEGIKHGIVQKFCHEPESSMNLIEEASYAFDVLHGPYKRWFPNGILCEDSIYDNNKLVVQKHYYISGQISAEYNYAEGQKHGPQRMWYPNGMMSFVGLFNKGMAIGQHIHYNNKGNKISLQTYNEEGKLHGASQKWHDNGQLEEDWGFINNEPHGLNFRYYENRVVSILFDHGCAMKYA